MFILALFLEKCCHFFQSLQLEQACAGNGFVFRLMKDAKISSWLARQKVTGPQLLVICSRRSTLRRNFFRSHGFSNCFLKAEMVVKIRK